MSGGSDEELTLPEFVAKQSRKDGLRKEDPNPKPAPSSPKAGQEELDTYGRDL